LLALGYLNNRF